MPKVPAASIHAHPAEVVLKPAPYVTAGADPSLTVGAGAPEVLQLVGVRLLVQLWQQSTQGRRGPAWSRLQVNHMNLTCLHGWDKLALQRECH